MDKIPQWHFRVICGEKKPLPQQDFELTPYGALMLFQEPC